MTSLRLYASGLLSKWGYGDGDCIDDWWWDTYNEDLPNGVDDHDALTELVELLLIPAIRAAGHTIETVHIGTIHNPIRAATIDGLSIDYYSPDDDPDLEWMNDIWVDITPTTIRELGAH